MRHPTPDYVHLVFREALQSLIGGGIATVVTMMSAGALVQLAVWNGRVDDWWVLAGCWIGHWVVAALMVWGVLVAAVPAWCFTELIHGRKDPLLILPIIFATQIVVSTAAVMSLDGFEQRRRAIFLSAILLSAMTIGLLRRMNRRKPN